MKLKLMLPLKTLADTLKRGHRTLGFFEIPRVWCPAFRLRPLILPVLAGLLAMWAEPAARADYTWTNTANGTSGFWTNGNLWATPANYPGSNAIDNAYLTNDTTAGATYTNILNFNLPKSLGTLAISNGAGGNAWLIVTNNAAGTGVGLTNATFILGNGGGLEIDSGGLFTNTTTFNWSGTNGHQSQQQRHLDHRRGGDHRQQCVEHHRLGHQHQQCRSGRHVETQRPVVGHWQRWEL